MVRKKTWFDVIGLSSAVGGRNQNVFQAVAVHVASAMDRLAEPLRDVTRHQSPLYPPIEDAVDRPLSGLVRTLHHIHRTHILNALEGHASASHQKILNSVGIVIHPDHGNPDAVSFKDTKVRTPATHKANGLLGHEGGNVDLRPLPKILLAEHDVDG